MSIPLDLSPSLWVKADAGCLDASDAPCTNGTAIKTWQDQSGGSLHLTQDMASARPIYTAGIINGLPVVRFSRAAGPHLLSRAAVNWAQPLSFAVLLSVTNNANTNGFFGDSVNGAIFYSYSGGTDLYAGTSVVNAAIKPPIAACVFSGVLTGASSAWYQNGTLGKNGNAGTRTITNLQVGSLWGNTLYTLTGDIGELLIFPSALSDPNRQAVEAYLRAKWFGQPTIRRLSGVPHTARQILIPGVRSW